MLLYFKSSEEDSDYSPEEEQYDLGEKTKIVAVVGIGHIAGSRHRPHCTFPALKYYLFHNMICPLLSAFIFFSSF